MYNDLLEQLELLYNDIQFSDINLLKDYLVEKDSASDSEVMVHVLSYNSYYKWNYCLGKLLKPKSILSIGVRFGYDTIATVLGSKIENTFVFGIDNECYEPDSNLITARSFRQLGINFILLKGDSIDSAKFYSMTEQFDLAYVDGNHVDPNLIRQDLEVAYASVKDNGVIAVDDYSFIEDVRIAVDIFVDEFKLNSYAVLSPKHRRGVKIIVK